MTMNYIPRLEELKNEFIDLQFRYEAEKKYSFTKTKNIY